MGWKLTMNIDVDTDTMTVMRKEKNRGYLSWVWKQTPNGVFNYTREGGKTLSVIDSFQIFSVSIQSPNIQQVPDLIRMPQKIVSRNENNNPILLTFTNNCAETVDILWLDFDGKGVKYSSIGPGKVYVQGNEFSFAHNNHFHN
jgi:hypothetical protein